MATRRNEGESRKVVSASKQGRKQVQIRQQPKSIQARAQRVRIAGQLRAVDPGDHSFTLVVDSGQSLRGIVDSLSPEHLQSLVDRTVVVSGTVTFQHSGSLLLLEADRIEPAQGDVSFWSRAPRPVLGKLDLAALRKPGSAWRETIGQWPGSETDEEILAALEELS